MDLPLDNDEALRDNRNEDVNAEWLIPEDIDEDQERIMPADGGDDDGDMEAFEEEPPDLHSLGSEYQRIGVRGIFDALKSRSDDKLAVPVVLYLLYADFRQEIVQELRAWMMMIERFEVWRITAMFGRLGALNIAEEIEQEHSEALLEFVDVLGSIMVGAWRKLRERSSMLNPFTFHEMRFPLHAPLGAVVAAKLLQYAQSVEPIERLALWFHRQYRVFRPDEVEQLVSSVVCLKQLKVLDIQVDITGSLLVDLCGKLKDLENLSVLRIQAKNEVGPQMLPIETQLIQNIQQISSLETLHLFFAILGESAVDLFAPPEQAYTRLELDTCRFLIGDVDDAKDPRELPLAVAVASNRHLEELYLDCVQGSSAFFEGIEHGLLHNRTLRTLRMNNLVGTAHQRIPEFAYFRWMQSIRLHPALRRLVLDMTIWSRRVTDAVCSVVRDNTSLHSMELFRFDGLADTDDEFDPEWIGSILQALQANRTMVDVHVRLGSAFADRNWTRLAKSLTVNNTIETIYLDAGDESIPERVIELLQGIKANRTLERASLNNLKFRQNHTSDLVDLLSDNFVLSSIDCRTHGFEQGGEYDPISCSDEGSQRLLRGILDLNYYGRNYMRTEPNSVLHGVELLSRVSSNLDAVYFHLRENPRLCDRREWK